MDITAKKTQKMREQAFIVYDNVASATTAKRSLNGFTFFNRPIVSVHETWICISLFADNLRIENRIRKDKIRCCSKTRRHF